MKKSMVATLPLASKVPVVLIANPASRRVELLRAAMQRLRLPPPTLVSYTDLLSGETSLTEHITPESLVRIESPGKDFSVERALLQVGTRIADPEGAGYTRFSPETVAHLEFDKGRLLPSRQWYLGYHHLLKQMERELSAARLFNHPKDISLLFDKRSCHALLTQHSIPVPPALPPIRSYAELLEGMLQLGWRRAFVKLAHGSSASGVVAYRFQGARQQAITTVEMVREYDSVKLYNSRRIRTYTDPADIALLIDTLCKERVHVEQWLPKATCSAGVFDLRVVVIAGRARHIVVRTSQSPLTNLHLLNKRGDVEAVRSMVGEEQWQAALASCERAARLFPSLYIGIDLLFTANPTRHAIIEMNAFGDLLPGVLYAGQDTYTLELVHALKVDMP